MYYNTNNGMYEPDVPVLVSIDEFADELIVKRDELCRPVVGKFNGAILMARFGDVREDIVKDFKKQMDSVLDHNEIPNSEGDVKEESRPRIKTEVFFSRFITCLRDDINEYLENNKDTIRVIDIKYSSAMARANGMPGTDVYSYEYSAMIIFEEVL